MRMGPMGGGGMEKGEALKQFVSASFSQTAGLAG